MKDYKQDYLDAARDREDLLDALMKLRHAFFVEGKPAKLKAAFAETHPLVKRLLYRDTMTLN